MSTAWGGQEDVGALTFDLTLVPLESTTRYLSSPDLVVDSSRCDVWWKKNQKAVQYSFYFITLRVGF